MKKTLFAAPALILILSLLLAPAALAVTEGEYDWQGETITVAVNERPMFAPAGMTDDQRGLALEITLSDGLMADEAKQDALYAQAALVDADGNVYRPGAATSRNEAPQLNYLYAIPGDIEVDALSLEFIAGGAIPAEYVGKWEGSTDSLKLFFHVEEDGTGTYVLEQAAYRESYDFALSLADDTFSVDIPANNQLDIVGCEGTYAYADEVLTLAVHTTFANGGEYNYTVSCQRVDEADAAESAIPEEYIGKWEGTSGDIGLVFEISADGRAKFTFTQGNYTESNDVALSVEDDTFMVEIPDGDTTTESCGGSYSFADGVLTVNVEVVFVGGRTFSYSVACEKAEA